jgi:DNA-binding MarR family transcriptional regulator
VQLTEAGRALIDDAVTAHVANEHQILSGLTREEQDTLARLLAKLVGSLS